VVVDCTEDLTNLQNLLQLVQQRADTADARAARARAKGTLSVLSDEATCLQSQIERETDADTMVSNGPSGLAFTDTPSPQWSRLRLTHTRTRFRRGSSETRRKMFPWTVIDEGFSEPLFTVRVARG